jgi:hypothetical protein
MKFVEKIKCQLKSKNKDTSNEDHRIHYYTLYTQQGLFYLT